MMGWLEAAEMPLNYAVVRLGRGVAPAALLLWSQADGARQPLSPCQSAVGLAGLWFYMVAFTWWVKVADASGCLTAIAAC
jgi:hypothetical protein